MFVPVSWDGIKIEPVEIKVHGDIPKEMKPYRARVPQSLKDAYERELERLSKYLYVPSDSPIASPIVVAKKATFPFIRICGDYRRINKFVEVPKYEVPSVIEELHKLVEFDVYHDLDVTNAFHQIPISRKSSRLLSVSTPFGQYEPKFLMEGVASASAILNMVMRQIFREFSEWTVVIHDNILVLAKGYRDAYEKLVLVLAKCREWNIFLKLEKSWFGVKSVNFFGYVCKGNSYELSEERKKSVTDITFPTDQKAMQRFLGSSMYFKPFIFSYSEKTAKLYDMIRNDFDWKMDLSNHLKEFEEFKLDILHSFSVYHPDASLDWFLYVDASDVALGGVLIQKTLDGVQQVIAFVSHKFSTVAKAWSTYEKEAYAMFYSVHQLRL